MSQINDVGDQKADLQQGPVKIVVGYRLRPVDYLEELLPPKPAEDEKTIIKAWEKMVDGVRTNATNNVYACTFDEVLIHVPALGKAKAFKSVGRKPDQPICLDVRNFLLHREMFKGCWGDSTNSWGGGPPKAIFMGFEPRFFLKLLGLECSMPFCGKRLPVEMWYGNSDHRDISEAIMPKSETKHLDWDLVLKARRRGLTGEDLERYDAVIDNWVGPGVDPEKDVKLTLLLGNQLGFLP